VKVETQVNASKSPQGRREALALAARARRIVAARGTKISELDLRTKPPEAEVLALMLGPTGNLRAPTMVVGDTLYVGFPKEGFPELAG
jgi:arsenate reductase-like glutaredoxin family protein